MIPPWEAAPPSACLGGGPSLKVHGRRADTYMQGGPLAELGNTMGKISRGDVFFQFALLSLLALAALGGVLAWLGGGVISGRAREGAAATALGAVAPAIQA